MAVTYLQRLVRHLSLLLACFFVFIGQVSAREGYGNENAQEYGDAVYVYSLLVDIATKNYNHAGIFVGMNSSDSKRVIEARLSNCDPDNSFQNSFTNKGDDYYGAYTLSNTTLTFSSRKAIVKTARDLVADGDIGYPSFPMLGHDALEYFGDYFSGYVSDIDTIRCDGVVEYCYEKNGMKVWWDTNHSSQWNIATDGGVEYHNNMPGSSVDPDFELSPWAQRGAPQVTGPSFNDPNPNNTKMTRSAVIDLPTYQASSWQSGSHMVVRINATDSKSGIHKISWRLPGESSGWHYARKSQHPDYDSSSVDINVYSEGTLYYWAQDNGGNQPQYAESLYVNFNEPPDTPYNESPNDGATGVSRTANLDWSCTDPDGDTIYYTVWLSKGNNTFSSGERIKIDAIGSNADAGTMDYGAHYYWKVQADDHKGGVTTVDHWDFYTESASTRIIRLSGDLAFGSVTVGQTSQRTLTIYNDGNSVLTVSGISHPTGFSGNWSGTVSAGGSRNVTVTFAPTAATSYGGTVTVSSNKTSGTNTRSCSGTGTTVPTRIIRLSGDLAFGSVTVGQTSQRTLTIYNDGNSILTVSGISYPTGFSGNWSGTISAGSSMNVTVTFSPQAAQNYSGNLSVSSNKTSGTNTRACSGTGVPVKPTVTVTATDSTASEPGTNTGKYRICRTGSTSSSLSVYFSMSGSATDGTDYYSISSPKTISAGSSYVDVTLTPKDDLIYEGDETATLTISTNSAYNCGSPYSATVTIQDDDSSTFEHGHTTLDHDWTSITLDNTYQNPVVIIGPPTYHGADPGVVRLRNVTNNSFDIRFQEWLYKDGGHTQENIPYLVISGGRHQMPDGSIWEAGTFFLSGTGAWISHAFTDTFPSMPALFLTTQTYNGSDPITVRARNITNTGFEAALFEEENKMDGHTTEEVGYLAVYSPQLSGIVSIDGTDVPYLLQAQSVDHRFVPVLSSDIKLEEEQSKDTEINHINETISILALGDKIFTQDISSNGGDTIAIRRLAPEYGAAMEWGTVDGVDQNWMKIPLAKEYLNPVVVAKPVSSYGGDPGVIRIRNVSYNSFELRYNEWAYKDGWHTQERVFYMVVEAGERSVAGLTVEARKLNTSKLLADGWEPITFSASFSQTPSVFTSVQTYNGADPVTTRVKSCTTAGFDLTMDEEEAKNDGHTTETIGWIAIKKGTGNTADNRSVVVLSDSTSHIPTQINFGQSMARRFPVVVSDMITTYGADPCFLRYQNLGSSSIDLFIQEEASSDAEMNHVVEDVSLFVAE